MDEIITRWASDLQKYQKEFKGQAEKISKWDRLLIENGEKIQKLFLSTHEAEKATSEIDRQLQSVESQQNELEAYLDKYEAEIDRLFEQQVGSIEQLSGPDQERERTYKLAENVTDRLDEMGKDLGKMISEINEISGSLNKGNKPDDPVSAFQMYIPGATANPTGNIGQPGCTRSQRSSSSAQVDRRQRCRPPGKGQRRAEGD